MATLRGETGTGRSDTEGGGNQEQGTREGGGKGRRLLFILSVPYQLSHQLGLADVDIMV